MTIPEGVNLVNASTLNGSGWQLLPSNRHGYGDDVRRILLIESYGAGSHLRVARLLQQHSRHLIDIVRLARDHWRTLAFAGHRIIVEALQSLQPQTYNLVLFSGPADVRLTLAALPVGWRALPWIAYFHESQWTYPAGELDRIPHLVNHLETVETCDAVWFNSHFHRDTFRSAALDHPSRTIQRLAGELIPDHWHKTAVVYPPVHVAERPIQRSSHLTVAWTARWEHEKRPDLMLQTIRECLGLGLQLKLHILGCSPDRWNEDPAINRDLHEIVDPLSGYLQRDEYEAVLAGSDVWLSTAEHEYFGVAAIEAAMLGATPVVPSSLAYPETLPSALVYPPGQPAAAARRIQAVAQADRPFRGPWRIDANRFRKHTSIERFDLDVLNIAK